MIHTNMQEPLSSQIHTHNHIHWSAILIGALVGVGLGFLLNLYGVAIGLSAYSSPTNGAQAVAIGGFIGMVIGVVASMVAAGYVAGYLVRSTCCHHHLGLIYGFSTWVVALILSALLIMPISHYVTAYTTTLSKTNVVLNKDNQQEPRAANATHNANNAMQEVPPQSKAAENLAWSAWLIFLLFFIGAISSCVGASWAVGCKRNDHQSTAV